MQIKTDKQLVTIKATAVAVGAAAATAIVDSVVKHVQGGGTISMDHIVPIATSAAVTSVLAYFLRRPQDTSKKIAPPEEPKAEE
jgi:hypothetical protein